MACLLCSSQCQKSQKAAGHHHLGYQNMLPRWENISRMSSFPPELISAPFDNLHRRSAIQTRNASQGLLDFSWSTYSITVFRGDSVLAKISTLPPLVTPSEVVRDFSQLTSDANTLQFFRLNGCDFNWQQFNETKLSFFTQETVQRVSTRVRKCVSPYSECMTFLTRCDSKTYLQKSD